MIFMHPKLITDNEEFFLKLYTLEITVFPNKYFFWIKGENGTTLTFFFFFKLGMKFK